MKRYWQYLKYVLRHKLFVFQECRKLGVPLLIAIFHDWDKFLPDEFIPYAKTFYKPDGSKQYDETPSFTLAWNLHQKRNKHHWQWWVIMFDRGEFETIEMTDIYRREMLADWRGAGRAITGKDNLAEWYLDNYYKIKLHRETRLWIDRQVMGMLNMMGTLEEVAQSCNADVLQLKSQFLEDIKKEKTQ